MTNISNNLIRTNYHVREIVFEVKKIKELLKSVLIEREKIITLSSIEGGKLDVDSNKIECVEEYTGEDVDYIGTKSVVYMISSNFFHVKETRKEIEKLRNQ